MANDSNRDRNAARNDRDAHDDRGMSAGSGSYSDGIESPRDDSQSRQASEGGSQGARTDRGNRGDEGIGSSATRDASSGSRDSLDSTRDSLDSTRERDR